MKKSVRVISIIVSVFVLMLAVFAAGILKWGDGHRLFCQLSLGTQIKTRDIAVVKVRIDKSVPQNALYCLYEVTKIQSFLEEFEGIPSIFKIEGLNWGDSCKSEGNHIFVVLKKVSADENIKTCKNAAVVNYSRENEIPNLLIRRDGEK